MISGEIVDCLVSYFGFGDDGGLTRYFCYHLIGGPGPTHDGGVASVVLLATHDNAQRCIGCQSFYVAPTGGPAAAIEEAVRYLDAYHQGERLRKVQTSLRGLSGDGGPQSLDAELPRTLATFPEFSSTGKRGE
jgi:hypothetical protein